MIEELPQEGPKITLIQKNWRGFLARRKTRIHAEHLHVEDAEDTTSIPPPVESYVHQQSSSRKLKVPPRTPPRGNSSKFEPKDVLPQSTKATEKIPFTKSYDLDVAIDGAIGLPLTTTLARIRVELHMPTKEILEIKSPYAYSDYLSEHTSPQFALKMNWKGKYIIDCSNCCCLCFNLIRIIRKY